MCPDSRERRNAPFSLVLNPALGSPSQPQRAGDRGGQSSRIWARISLVRRPRTASLQDATHNGMVPNSCQVGPQPQWLDQSAKRTSIPSRCCGEMANFSCPRGISKSPTNQPKGQLRRRLSQPAKRTADISDRQCHIMFRESLRRPATIQRYNGELSPGLRPCAAASPTSHLLHLAPFYRCCSLNPDAVDSS